MKKTLLSVIAGLAVINAASAVPSPADRKALCEKHPDKYVWVEKTEACVPINPCKSDNSEIVNAYCIKDLDLPYELSAREVAINRYAEKELGTGISSIKNFDVDYVAVKTTDGRYFVARMSTQSMNSETAAKTAFWSYGYPADTKTFSGGERCTYAYVRNAEECQDIKDFASLLFGEIINGEWGDESGNAIGCFLACKGEKGLE